MKTKRGGRELNPTDAYRKQSRKREIKRNRAERTYIRDAFGKAQHTEKLNELKAELEELIKLENEKGELNKLQKLRKRVVLDAYEVAVRKKKVRTNKQCSTAWPAACNMQAGLWASRGTATNSRCPCH
jgi:DNA repair ATPase RecN